MKKLLCLLCLALMPALALNGLAEAADFAGTESIAGDAAPAEAEAPLPEDAAAIDIAAPVDEAVAEVEFELGAEPAPEAMAPTVEMNAESSEVTDEPAADAQDDADEPAEDPGEAAAEPAEDEPAVIPAEDPEIAECAPDILEAVTSEAMFSELEIEVPDVPEVPAVPEAMESPAAPEPDAMQAADEDTAFAMMAAGEAMPPVRLRISGRATRKIYAGVPYQIRVKGRAIKGCSSRNPAVASVTGTGLLTPIKPGRAKIIVRTRKKKIALTVKVMPSPAPGKVRARIEGGAFLLSWRKAKQATGYLIQGSPDGINWTDALSVGANVTTADITAAVTGPGFFRVVTLLGDRHGGASPGVSVLGPVSDLRVICEEVYLQGPTDRVNVTWTGTAGATGYNVYRATLPSEDYQLIGTTPNTWFADTRPATQLCAYRVQPLCGGVEVPPSPPVTLWTGMPDNVLPPANMTSETGIILLVNKQAQIVTAYGQDASGAYTVPIRHMICSSGSVYDRTRNGTYTLKAREGEWYRYPSGVYIRYPSIYRDGYYFHSPLYSARKHIMSDTVGKLGTRQSLGCIRLKMRDAQWIYENCPAGTRVYICDGAKRPALKKAIRPARVKVKGF